MTDAITIQNPRNRGGSTGHVLAKRSVTFTEIRTMREFLEQCRALTAGVSRSDQIVLPPII